MPFYPILFIYTVNWRARNEYYPCLSHVSLGSNDFEAAAAFTIVRWPPWVADACWNIPAPSVTAATTRSFGCRCRLTAGLPPRQRHARRLFATSKQQVDEFHRQALLAGAVDEGAPGSRPHYGEAYYGCFVRDLDGHKIEASFWDESAA